MNLNLNYRKDTWKCINISFYFKMAKKKVTKSKPIKVIEEQSKSDFKTLKNYIRIFFYLKPIAQLIPK